MASATPDLRLLSQGSASPPLDWCQIILLHTLQKPCCLKMRHKRDLQKNLKNLALIGSIDDENNCAGQTCRHFLQPSGKLTRQRVRVFSQQRWKWHKLRQLQACTKTILKHTVHSNNDYYYYYYYTCLTPSFPGQPGYAGIKKVEQSGIK